MKETVDTGPGLLEDKTDASSRSSISHFLGTRIKFVDIDSRCRTIHRGYGYGCIWCFSTMDRRFVWVEQGEDDR